MNLKAALIKRFCWSNKIEVTWRRACSFSSASNLIVSTQYFTFEILHDPRSGADSSFSARWRNASHTGPTHSGGSAICLPSSVCYSNTRFPELALGYSACVGQSEICLKERDTHGASHPAFFVCHLEPRPLARTEQRRFVENTETRERKRKRKRKTGKEYPWQSHGFRTPHAPVSDSFTLVGGG